MVIYLLLSSNSLEQYYPFLDPKRLKRKKFVGTFWKDRPSYIPRIRFSKLHYFHPLLHYIPTPQNGKRIVTKRICHFRALQLWPFVASKFSWKHIIAQTLFAQLDELECRKREKKKDMIISLTFFYRHIWLGWPLVLNLKTLNWTANKKRAFFYCFIFGHHHVLGSTSSGDMCTVH